MRVTLITALAVPLILAPQAASADQMRDMQWTLKALGVTKSWAYSKGTGVTVAVLDTGVDAGHPDLSGQVITGPDYTGHSTPKGSAYWARHGTAMAGIIAGRGHGLARADGIMGVAPNSKILSIKVTWENNDPARHKKQFLDLNKNAMARGIRYAVDHGAKVVNMSLGGGKTYYNGNAVEQEAIDYAVSKGVVLVASMGNDGSGQNRRNFPAAYRGVVAVGAVDAALKPWPDSNRHDYVSVAAPGVTIVTTAPRAQYANDTGTSASAAFVAGIAALIKARYPDLSSAQVKLALEKGVTHRPPGGRDQQIGTGVIDAFAALKAANKLAKAGPALPPPSPAVTPTATATASPATHAAGDGEGGGQSSAFVLAVLACGGVLLTSGLFIAYRKRSRKPSAAPPGPDLDPVPPPRPAEREREPVLAAPTTTDPEAATPLAGESWRAVQAADPHDDRYRPPWA
ncbi:S8 family peptidase [Actinocorallia longicatena]|uniref:Peptidase S8/S53 domain-containing protein n=1 Tax=Actinocorallia longicatena TaxID=111803 RepID=A0ABP6QEP7_9ACTN